MNEKFWKLNSCFFCHYGRQTDMFKGDTEIIACQSEGDEEFVEAREDCEDFLTFD